MEESAVNEFFYECEEILQRVSSTLSQKEPSAISHSMIDSLYRDVHTIKGSSQLFGFHNIALVAHAIEASLEPVRSGKTSLDKSYIDFIFKGFDLIEKILREPERDLNKDPSLQAEIVEALPHLVSFVTKRLGGEFYIKHDGVPDASARFTPEVVKEEKAVSPSVVTESAPRAQTEKPASSEETNVEATTIRVQVGLLDKLMNLVGEMVLTRNQVLQYARKTDEAELLALTQKLDLVTGELQDNVMKTRMQPIGTVFSKFQRVIRDLSRDLGKNIELVVQGAETELDKSLIEAIKDPLTHIIRNSCDHGIESIEKRKAKGKPEKGILQLKAFHEGGQVIIEIRDDGGGIHPEKVKAKAIDKGLISKERAAMLSDKEAQELIFAAGFSTAEQVTSISGRGVGMDVVRNNVEKVGGMIELESVPDQGTSLRLRIPLTLAIVPAMIIRSGKDHFAVPQVKLQELLRIDMEDPAAPKIEKLQGQDVFRLRGKLLPLISCQELMNAGTTREQKSVYNVVVLHGDPYAFGLIVDEICDTADIVVKPLPPFLKKADMFSGSTIMGDGSVSLILDTQGVSNHMKVSQRAADMQKKQNLQTIAPTKSLFKETNEFLFFKLSHPGTYAIPLILVQRLEEFSREDIQHSGQEKIIKYRDTLLPLIFLNEYLGFEEKSGDDDSLSKISVIVVSKSNRLFGFVVNEVQDVLLSDCEIIPHVREAKGLLGTIIAQDKSVITIIDTYSVIGETVKASGGPSSSGEKIKQRSGKILFAEDTNFFVKLVRGVLEKAGYEVTHAPDGEVALRLLKAASPGAFDFVISDIEMPNLNGFGFAAAVRKDGGPHRNLPMVALTTRFTEADQKRGKDAGFNMYLEKLKSDELLEALDRLTEERK